MEAEGGASLFALVINEKMCPKDTKLCQWRFRLVIRHWNMLSGEVIDASCLSVFKEAFAQCLHLYALRSVSLEVVRQNFEVPFPLNNFIIFQICNYVITDKEIRT